MAQGNQIQAMPADAAPLPRPRTTTIKNLPTILPERGKIKIGRKGAVTKSKAGNEFQPPQKLDHFIVTTMVRGQDGNFVRDEAVHAEIGDKPRSIPIRLLYDDPTLNFQSRYSAYKGRTMWCTGDGETALRLTPDGKGRASCPCPCLRAEPGYEGSDKCKMNGRLQALVGSAATVGGVHTFRTTSFNTITGITASLQFIRSITGGPLAGIPLNLTVSPKETTAPDGKTQTVYVVGIEYAGTIDALEDHAHRIALRRATAGIRIEQVEQEARALLALPAPENNAPFADDDADDVVDEFYSEQAEASVNPPPRPTRAALDDRQSEPSINVEAPVFSVPMIGGEYEDIEGADDAITALLSTAEAIVKERGKFMAWLAAAKPAIDAIHDAEGPRSDNARRLHSGIELLRSAWEAQQRAGQATQNADKPASAPTRSIERYRFQPLKGNAIPDLSPDDFAHQIREAAGSMSKRDREALRDVNHHCLDRLRTEQDGLWDGVSNVLGI